MSAEDFIFTILEERQTSDGVSCVVLRDGEIFETPVITQERWTQIGELLQRFGSDEQDG